MHGQEEKILSLEKFCGGSDRSRSSNDPTSLAALSRSRLPIRGLLGWVRTGRAPAVCAAFGRESVLPGCALGELGKFDLGEASGCKY